jgi:Na+/melibiose symporter-like transporter
VTRTKPLHLLVLAVFGAAVLWFVETALAASGQPVLIPPFTLAVALVLIGAIIVAMAWPVRRVARGDRTRRVDPFFAARVVLLAKASSLGGALLAGAGLGIAGYLLSRSVIPAVGSVTMGIATAVGAILLLAAGLVAEHWCTIPPDDDDKKKRQGAPDPQGLS